MHGSGPHARRLNAAAVAVLAISVVAGCGSSKNGSNVGSVSPSTSTGTSAPGSPGSAPPGAARVENNPPGDIPDNAAYVPYQNSSGHYSFVHPEGWARTENGSSVMFTDKLNGISAAAVAAATTPTVASAKATTVPALTSSQPAFELVAIKSVKLPGGGGILLTYRRNSAADPVTGKVFRDEVQRYEIFSHGHRVNLELYGAVGSDNVDPYAKISQSLMLS